MPLGYTESWGFVRIEGLSTATNGAVLSAPGSAVVSGAGTGELYIGFFGLLPQTQYTMQATFDVANASSSSVPYKPKVTISESFGANLAVTPAQPSYVFVDTELGTTTWSVDQSVVWTPRMFRNTTVIYSPVPVAPTLPAANAYDWRGTYIELDPATDSVGSAAAYTGWQIWEPYLRNMSTLTIPAPEISFDQSSRTFTPPLTFPQSSGPGADLTAQYQSFIFNALAGRWFGGSEVDGVGFSTGFDLTRTESPATLPAGGGTQDVTVSFVARDARYAHTGVELLVQAGDRSVDVDAGRDDRPRQRRRRQRRTARAARRVWTRLRSPSSGIRTTSSSAGRTR